MKTIIDVAYSNGNLLLQHLLDQKEITLHQNAEADFNKTILLSVASYFEDEIKNLLLETTELHTKNNELIVSMIKQKIIDRDYHTLFAWKEKNANTFFKLFGEQFKRLMESKVKDDDKLDKAVKAFLELGRERNNAVHGNFAAISPSKTTVEIYELYQSALYFLETLKSSLLPKNGDINNA